MNTPTIPLEEFDAEMASTRKLLERIPSDKGTWKPHEKSFSLAHLSQLISWMPAWIARTLREPHIDLLNAGVSYSVEETPKLVAAFDKNVADARSALIEVTGDRLKESWSLKRGDMVVMTLPRGIAVRQHMSHIVHHRGQLSVYARMVEVPLPMMYGPTADERS